MSIKVEKMKVRALLLGPLVLSLSACASGGAAYQPIIDGPLKASYSQDILECRDVASKRKYINSDTKTNALLGAGAFGLSALGDSDDDDLENFIGGALIGSLIGGSVGAFEARGERKEVLLNCMAGRGHNVVG